VQTDAAGTPTPMPFRLLSQGVPTAEFMASAGNWNAQSMFVRDRVVAAGPGTVASLEALAVGTLYPTNTLIMTITTGAGPVEVRSPIEATFDGFLVAAGAAVVAGQQLAVYGNLQASEDLPITAHATVDPTTLDDAGLERRMRELCDEILHLDRASPDYQNKRFEIRGLGQVAVDRGTDAVDSGHTYTVRGGDTLWGIAAAHLGGGPRWTRIMALNVVDLQDPNIIRTGAVLKMPQPYHP
jgi:LysM repeat protein